MARKKTKSPNKLYIVASAVAVVILAIGTYALFRGSPNTSTTIPSTSPTTSSKSAAAAKPTNNSASSSTGNTTSTQPDKTASNISSSGNGPVKPFGTFVSNSSPQLSDTAQQQEVSVCNTTAGATCSIQFVMGSTPKELQPQTVDSSGSTSWYWNLSTAGFTAGTWQYTVIASLNGQTQSSTGTLVVSQ